MEEHGNKTIMCSVLFLDIVEYSKKTVSGQIALKDDFNSLLSTSIHDVPLDDRIILDTGDGAAVSFLGDVEDALKVALRFRQGLLNMGADVPFPLRVRMGINLGPVRLVKDINGQPNIMGDGINVAQRVMGFANDGQVLVSRSYFDAVSRLSADYANLFHNEGSRTDKHVREHEVYAIGYPGEVTATRQKMAGKATQGTPAESTPATLQSKGSSISMATRVVAYWQEGANWLGEGLRGFGQAPMQKRATLIAVLALPVLLLGTLVLKIAHHAPSDAPAATEVATAAPATTTPEPAISAVPEKPVKTPATSKPAKTEKPKKTELAHGSSESSTAEQAKIESAKTEPNVEERLGVKMTNVRTLEQTTAVDAGAKASVDVAVAPWGEVYLDGRMQGVSPPLAELQVAPGKHELEIRNTSFPAYVQRIEVKAGERIKVKHKF